MLPCTEEEVEAYFILFLIYTSLSTLFGPSRSPFLTSRRYTVWEWHKRSLRVNTRLQRESAINTIHTLMTIDYVCTQVYANLVISTLMSHCLYSCSYCIHNVLLTVEHFQFFVKVFFARDSRWWNSIRPEGGHTCYRPFL